MLTEFQLEQTSLLIGKDVHLLKSSRGLGWMDLYAAVTDESPHEGLRGAVPAVWIVTASTPNDIQRVSSDNRYSRVLPKNAISITTSGDAVYDELISPLRAQHFYLRQKVIDDVAEEVFVGSRERRFIRSMFGLNDPVLWWLLTSIEASLDESPFANRLKMDCLTQALAACLLAKYSVVGDSRPLPVYPFNVRQIGELCSYINDNLSSNMSIDDLAKVVGQSRAQFMRRFKATTLLTPHRFLVLRRLRHARKLLAIPRMDYAAIALACGFVSQSYFTTVFKRIEGVTPREYRQMLS
jgi:AraC-like DNA-binding protein